MRVFRPCCNCIIHFDAFLGSEFCPPFWSHSFKMLQKGGPRFLLICWIFLHEDICKIRKIVCNNIAKLTVPVIYNLTERQYLPLVLLVVPLLLLMPPPRNCMRRTLPTTPLCLDTLYDMPATPVSFVLEPNTEINKIVNIRSMWKFYKWFVMTCWYQADEITVACACVGGPITESTANAILVSCKAI